MQFTRGERVSGDEETNPLMHAIIAHCMVYETQLPYAAANFQPSQISRGSSTVCTCKKINTCDRTDKAGQLHLAADGSPAAAAVAMRSWQLGRMPAQLGRQGGCSSLTRLPLVPAQSTPLTPLLTHPAWPGPVPMMHHHLWGQVACLASA